MHIVASDVTFIVVLVDVQTGKFIVLKMNYSRGQKKVPIVVQLVSLATFLSLTFLRLGAEPF